MKPDEGGRCQFHMFCDDVDVVSEELFEVFEDASYLLHCPYSERFIVWASLLYKSEDESKPLLWREMKMMVSFGAFFVHRILVFVHQISLSFGWLGVASEKVLVGGKFWCTWRSVWSYPDWWEEEDLVNNILNLLLLKVAAKSVWKVILTSVKRPSTCLYGDVRSS